MSEEKENYKSKAVGGVLFLGFKRIVIQVIYTVSNIFLARLLFPEDFGAFAIVISIGALFTVFSDLGLSPSLIQKKENIEKNDIQTSFTAQLILGIVVILIIYFISGLLAEFFNLGQQGVNLLKIYSLIFLIAPFRNIPDSIIERSLDYKKLVIVEIIGIFIGSGTTVTLAFLGTGVFSFVYGILSGHLTSATLYYLLVQWPVGISISKKNLFALSRFGLPYQTNMILGLFYGPLILLYLGKQVGPENLGFFHFAAGLAVLPLAIPEILGRVIFPLGSRLQSNREFLVNITERAVATVSMTALPIVFIFIAVAPSVIHFIYTDKWLPSLPVLYLGLLQMGIMAYTSVFQQLLLAQGKAKTIRNMAFFWVALTWILAPPLINAFNFVGMGIASLLVAFSGVWLLFKLKQLIDFSFWRNFSLYFISVLVSSLVVAGIINLSPLLVESTQ